MENIIKKLKGSGGISLKPRVGSGSHSQQGCKTPGQVCVADTLPEVVISSQGQTPFQRWVISSRCCSGSYVPDFEFCPPADVLVANYSTDYKFLLCHFMNLVSQNIKSSHSLGGSLIEKARG